VDSKAEGKGRMQTCTSAELSRTDERTEGDSRAVMEDCG